MRGGEKYWKLKWLASKINKEAGLDIFKNTRQRDYTEARSVFNFIARKLFNYKFVEIAKFYEINGKACNHATVIYSINTFDSNIRFSTKMQSIYNSIDLNVVMKNEKKAKAMLMLEKLTDDNAVVAHEYVKSIYYDQQRLEQLREQVVYNDLD